jgi:hypothetical protein
MLAVLPPSVVVTVAVAVPSFVARIEGLLELAATIPVGEKLHE